ncbi:MAG TPA: amino acid adenylation domain-containing protein, partial [Chthonomonadaceae bacterium]|nr:amino acid adenylation domain-containing protein [Chthonomonadaceae bacterium]
ALPLPVVDLSQAAEPERQQEAGRLLNEAAQRPFDLEGGPLFRALLLKLGAEEYILVLSMHHIVSDGWSLGVLTQELTVLYAAFSSGQSSPLPELEVQYADYAVWQREWLRGKVLEDQVAYWRQHLQGAPALLELPMDRPRPPMQTFAGAIRQVKLSSELLDQLKGVCQTEGVTLFMSLLAAFQVLLSRYSGQEDIVVGTPIANRTQQEMEGLIGFFANTLALRGDLSGDPSFRELLGRVREAALGAYAHQDLPFEKLVEELQLPRSLSHSPIFQVMFILQYAPYGNLQMPGLRVEGVEAEGANSKFDLTLVAMEDQGQLQVWLEYNTDLFSEERMLRLLGHYERLLEGIVADPMQKLSHLPLLTEAERRQLVVEFNATSVASGEDVCIHTLFEAQVERTPDAIALRFGDRQLTYRELNEQANRLARALRKRGVGAETLVGLYVERSLEMVVGLLGVLKAGGAYLPLDPEYPQERVAFMLEDASVRLVLTQSHLAQRIEGLGSERILLDQERFEEQGTSNPGYRITPRNLAYVIYTSGSTGRPKGVLLDHHGLVNYLRWAVDAYAVDEGAGAPVHSPLGFDLTITSLYTPLLAGRTVTLLPEDHAVEQLGAALAARSAFSLVKLTPAHVELLSQMLPAEVVGESARTLVIGGEALTADHLAFWRTHAPGVRLINEYGPTETVVGCCIYEVPSGVALSGSIPIGRPIANTHLFVLDAHMHPAPLGVPGELYIGGAGLARGYLNRADLTAEKFVPDPFSSEPGARLYRTGDLCRYLPDGNLEFLGRIDHQVKIRGFRIELGEIESALREYPSLAEAVVLAREDVAGDKRLVAYVVGSDGAVSVSALREHLKDRLPGYMVPSAFVLLDALPLNTNGKVDRKALPAPDAESREETYVAPRNPIEEGMAQIWSEVLNLERIGIHANFFELGGHSLLATQVISRIRTTFQTELPVRALFEAPTIAELAERLTLTQGEESASTPALVPVSRTGPMPLSFSQQRLWFLDQLEPGSNVYNIPCILRLTGTLNVSALQQSLAEIVRRHEALRTTFRAAEDEPVQVIGTGFDGLQVEAVRGGSASDREREAQRRLNAEVWRAFDLEGGPLFRALLLKLGAEEHILVLSMHHIVSDGWSLGVLTKELMALYAAFSSGQSSPLPELEVQYADYAMWQREWLSGKVLEDQVAYWRQHLQGVPALLELPMDRPRPPMQTFQGARLNYPLSAELTQAVKQLGQRAGATVFMTLLAAFQALLSRYSGQEEIVVGTPIANRKRRELEGLIGFFANTLALRGDLSGDPSFSELLGRVREAALGAYAHQDLPFEKLVEELQLPRSLSHSPIFQVMFILQNAPHSRMQAPGMQADIVEAEVVSSKFDLTLVAMEDQGQLQMWLEYNTDLFSEERMLRLLGHYDTLLQGIVADPRRKISALPLLTERERHQLLVEFNANTAVSGVEGLCIHELFEQQVERAPDAVAVAYGDQVLSYGELNRRANQVAHALRKRGVGSETLVGLYVERSLEMVVGL